MLRTRGKRTSIIALAIAASAAALPGSASAETTVPQIPEGLNIEALASLAPAIIGAAAQGDLEATDVASPQQDLLAQARTLLDNSSLPDATKATLERVITFLDGSGGGGPELPPSDGPVISQFLYPTLGKGCIGGTSDSIGAALAVPGPAILPPPGPAAGQTGFVFTALGTSKATDAQPTPLFVDWVNIDHPKQGRTELTTASRINPDGPATLSGIADTGQGRVLAVVSGGLTTEVEGGAPNTCTFLPTVGTVYVP